MKKFFPKIIYTTKHPEGGVSNVEFTNESSHHLIKRKFIGSYWLKSGENLIDGVDVGRILKTLKQTDVNYISEHKGIINYDKIKTNNTYLYLFVNDYSFAIYPETKYVIKTISKLNVITSVLKIEEYIIKSIIE